MELDTFLLLFLLADEDTKTLVAEILEESQQQS